jgi:hypothetical protein
MFQHNRMSYDYGIGLEVGGVNYSFILGWILLEW